VSQNAAVLGIEAIVQAASAEEIEQAVAAGVKLVACSAALRDSVPKDVGAVGLLDSRLEKPEGRRPLCTPSRCAAKCALSCHTCPEHCCRWRALAPMLLARSFFEEQEHATRRPPTAHGSPTHWIANTRAPVLYQIC
jgi:hypothetical protein